MSEKSFGTMSRRGFLQASALAGATAALAGCSAGGEKTDTSAAPAADKYPIDAEEWGKGTVRHAEEVIGDERTGDGFTRVTNEGGATLSVMDASKLIQVDGFAFKDTNGNGKLDLWEDWRQTAEDRASALAEAIDGPTAAALMVHGSIFTLDTDLAAPFATPGKGEPTSMTETLDEGVRTMLNFSFSSTDPRGNAKWNNAMQAYAEGKDFSIPVNISNNPQDFGFPCNLGLAATFDPDLAKKVAQEESKAYHAEGVNTLLGPQIDCTTEPRWSRITGTYGEDPALSRDMTNAYSSGLQSTFDKDGNDLGWGEDSTIAMIKHFPGDGSAESGREAHNAYGKFNVYPGNNFKAHLVPFIDGGMHLDGATGQAAGVMPSYSIAWSDNEEYGELVGSGFSKWKMDILREKAGYDGLICTDWGIIEDEGADMVCTPWGMERATTPERVVKAVDAGVDQIGGGFSVYFLKDAFETISKRDGEEKALAHFRECARRVLKTFYHTGLSDDPYRETANSESVIDSSELASFASDVVDKSIVMLKNSGAIKKTDGSKPKVYIPMSYSSKAGWALPVTEKVASELFDIVTDTVGDPTGDPDKDGKATYALTDVVRASAEDVAACDMAAVFISSPSTGAGYLRDTKTYVPISLQYGEYVADGPHVREESLAGDIKDGVKENRSYLGQKTVATNLYELELVQSVRAEMADKPVVVCVNADRPMVFSEVEPLADAILMGFSAAGDDFLNILAGKVEPSGLLPLQMPKDMDAVEAQKEDVPRDMDVYVDSTGNEYDFAFGLNWSGVIKDDRVSKYGDAEPLTKPETLDL